MDDPHVSFEIVHYITTAERKLQTTTNLWSAQACLRSKAAACCSTTKRFGGQTTFFAIDARSVRFYNRRARKRHCMWVVKMLHPIIAENQL
jgi:hypothetical protein